MASKRQFVQGYEEFSHTRTVPRDELYFFLVELSIESLCLYKAVVPESIFLYLKESLLNRLATSEKADECYPEYSQHLRQVLESVFDGQNIRVLDSLFADDQFKSFVSFFSNHSQPQSESTFTVLRRASSLLNLNILFRTKESNIRFSRKIGIKCFLEDEEENIKIFYYKISYYNNEQEKSQKTENPKTGEILSCKHRDFERCLCQKYSIEGKYCENCFIYTDLGNFRGKLLCAHCIDVFKSDEEKNRTINHNHSRYAIQIHYPIKVNPRHSLGMPQRWDKFEKNRTCEGCCETVKKTKNIIKVKNRQLCLNCAIMLLEEKKILLNEMIPFFISQAERIDLARIMNSKFDYSLKGILTCTKCESCELVCFCKCFDCVKELCPSLKCPECHKKYSKEFRYMLSIKNEEFCNSCLKRKTNELLNIESWMICKRCACELLNSKKRNKKLSYLKIGTRINKNKIHLETKKIQFDFNDLSKIVFRLDNLNIQICIRCSSDLTNGCKCMCFDCCVKLYHQRELKACWYCKSEYSYLRTVQTNKDTYLCKCDERTNHAIHVKNLKICIQCYYNDIIDQIDSVRTYKYRKFERLNKIKLLLRIEDLKNRYKITHFLCYACNETKELKCCLTCKDCIEIAGECPFCKNKQCPKCKRTAILACNCMCIYCADEHHFQSCLKCLKIFKRKRIALDGDGCFKCGNTRTKGFVAFKNEIICIDCAMIILMDYQSRLYLSSDLPQAIPEHINIVQMIKIHKNPNFKNLLCRKCLSFKPLKCNCICVLCYETDGKRDCTYCKNTFTVSDDSNHEKQIQFLEPKDCSHSQLKNPVYCCLNKCECGMCVFEKFCKNQVNSSCSKCRMPYNFQSIDIINKYSCILCSRSYPIKQFLIYCRNCPIYVCFECVRNDQMSTNTTCLSCCQDVRISQFEFEGQFNLIDCCFEYKKDDIFLCNCQMRHIYHSSCRPPCFFI